MFGILAGAAGIIVIFSFVVFTGCCWAQQEDNKRIVAYNKRVVDKEEWHLALDWAVDHFLSIGRRYGYLYTKEDIKIELGYYLPVDNLGWPTRDNSKWRRGPSGDWQFNEPLISDNLYLVHLSEQILRS